MAAANPAAVASAQSASPAHQMHAGMADMKGAMPCHARMMGNGKTKPRGEMDCCDKKMSGEAKAPAAPAGK
ncbi:hypothetical protein [Sphingobium cupriresistens]|uniref:Uncharacterized protein n=2 Tax=Sphingomonadaceae TaxID=41297 RepID=A0A8G1ZCS5_9SPHN|nr:hypothetical protein [Sphingobium cupriresistens]RSU69157.1 hypothetical protein BRX36_01830 [Sphingomonas sp. S-NIH.Pt1_0416]RYM07078.1 hypothetical protein EWH12_19385 [Sphingobium cupriresistens]